MNTIINQKFNEELMALIGKEEKEEEVCLIDGTHLKDQFIELKCSHKFNYISILNEIKMQRKYNNLETQKINPYQIKCPYCRMIHNGILPYYETLFHERLRGVNWPPSKVLKSKKCQSILKSGKRKGELCSKSCINKHCGRHQKIKLVHPGCSVILKSGKRKGKICGCKCKKDSEKCGRHFSKKSIKTNVIIHTI
jgi:hypothetical protein